MKRFVEGADRDQTFLLPPSLEDYAIHQRFIGADRLRAAERQLALPKVA